MVSRIPFVRRWFYNGRRLVPVNQRPHPAWPPQRDPWNAAAETQQLPPYPLYEKRER
jgi:hypothetical protein